MNSERSKQQLFSHHYYVEKILSVLPDIEVARQMGDKLQKSSPQELYPERGESLRARTWLKDPGESEKIKLMLVVGESRGMYRLNRSDLILIEGERNLTMAGTCDGVGGARATLGLIQHAGLQLEKVDFDAQLDEWPTVVEKIDRGHLVVVGTGEVNILATFLHGMVADFFCGNCKWPPNLPSLGDIIKAGKIVYHRNPGGNTVENHGAVILLKNPWNPDFRLLWIAGLSGQASVVGCSQVASNWEKYCGKAENAIGVIFRRISLENREKIQPEAWLVWDGDKPQWVKDENVDDIIAKNREYERLKSEKVLHIGTMIQQSVTQGNFNIEQSGNFGIGHMTGGTIAESAKVVGVINEAQPKNLAEVAAEIQDLLNYFQEHNPTIAEAQQIVKTVTERQPSLKDATIIEAAIETTPTLKQRLKAAGEAAYVETVKMLLPPVGIAIEAVKAWQNPE